MRNSRTTSWTRVILTMTSLVGATEPGLSSSSKTTISFGSNLYDSQHLKVSSASRDSNDHNGYSLINMFLTLRISLCAKSRFWKLSLPSYWIPMRRALFAGDRATRSCALGSSCLKSDNLRTGAFHRGGDQPLLSVARMPVLRTGGCRRPCFIAPAAELFGA